MDEKRMDRRDFCGVATAILGGVASGFGGLSSAYSQTIKDEISVGWLRLACTGQSFVAEGAGHGAWAELMMKHQLFNAGAESIEAMGAGVISASYLGVTPAISAITRGVPAKMYVGGHRRGMGLVIPAGSKIQSIKDLRGKNISTLGRGSLPDMQLRVTARENGLDPDRDFNLIPLPSAEAVSALAKGSIDGLMNCPEWPQVALTTLKNSKFLVTDMDGSLWHGPDTQCVVVIVKNDFVAKNPRALKKLLHVHVKASRMMVDQPKESAQIISKYEGAPVDASLLALSHMYVSPVPSVDSLLKWRDKMFEFGMLKRKPLIKELLDLGPLRDVLKEAKEKVWLEDLDKQMALFEAVREREG